MESNTNNIRCAGILQDLGKPFASLYVDMVSRVLYVFVLTSALTSSVDQFVAAEVNPSEVESYMSEDRTLTNLFESKKIFSVTHDSRGIVLEDFKDFRPTENMKKLDTFDPELCEDDIWIETFLDRLTSNRPLEV